MLAATLFAGYKCIGVQMLLATLLATNKCVGGQMLIKIYLFEGRFFVRNEVKMKVENGKFYFRKDDFFNIFKGYRLMENKENGNIKYLRMIYNKLIESEVDEKVANMIIEDIDTSLKKESNIDNIISAIYQKIILKLGEPEAVNTDNGRTAVFFLGPTGVGKTTTIAKLASEFKLNKGLKVALITADTYRIAAVEQLNTYAGILDVPVSVIFTPEELVEALNKYSDYDLILIDTAGRSHRNTEQVGELEQLLEVTEKAELDINIVKYLVMSATTKYRDLLNITDAYKDIKDFRLLFTKLDETNAYGNILNIRIHTGEPLSYITSGQAVPEDISVVDVQDLAKRLIIGEVKDSEN